MWNKPCLQVRTIFGPNDRREMQLLAAMGAALVWTKGPGPEADAAFEDALKIAKSLDDADYQIRILWGLWSSHFNSGRIRMSLDTARQIPRRGGKSRRHRQRRSWANARSECRYFISATTPIRVIMPNRCFVVISGREIGRTSSASNLIRALCRAHCFRSFFGRRDFPIKRWVRLHGVVEEATIVGHGMSLALALAQGACPVTLLSGDLTAAERFIDLLLKHTLEHALDLWHAWGTCFGAMLLIARGSTDEGLKTLQRILDELPQGCVFRALRRDPRNVGGSAREGRRDIEGARNHRRCAHAV